MDSFIKFSDSLLTGYEKLSDYIQSTFTWDPKWTQTGLRFHFGVKFHFGIR